MLCDAAICSAWSGTIVNNFSRRIERRIILSYKRPFCRINRNKIGVFSCRLIIKMALMLYKVCLCLWLLGTVLTPYWLSFDLLSSKRFRSLIRRIIRYLTRREFFLRMRPAAILLLEGAATIPRLLGMGWSG